jgi:hypothetical protein
MANQNSTLTQEYLHSLFYYKDGNLYSKINRYKTTIRKNDLIKCYLKSGYLRTCINYKSYRIHRLIFMMHHGYLPKQIDHINGIKDDNRIENLRAATQSQNLFNRTLTKSNTSGIKNVTFEQNKYRVRLRINNKLINFGSYDDLELAELVAIEARDKYHGEFARS